MTSLNHDAYVVAEHLREHFVEHGNVALAPHAVAKLGLDHREHWAVLGDGWAVHGVTQEEALQRYHEAEQRHMEIDQRPLREPLFVQDGE